MRSGRPGLAVLAVCLALGGAEAPPVAATPDTDSLIQGCLEASAAVRDYTCRFSRRERVGDAIKEQRDILMKFRTPAAVYLKWTAGSEAGSEAIWAKDRNGGQLRVHLGGWLSFVDVNVDPAGKRAMKGNRHPITEIGLGFLTEKIISEMRRGRAAGEGTLEFVGEKQREGRACWVFRGTSPAGKGYYCGEAVVWIDQELRLPTLVTVSGWQGEFWEEYRFDDVRLNIGLTDADFDPENSAYGF